MRLGVISDSHGKLDCRVTLAFAEVDRILHAGDVCAAEVLWELEALGKPMHVVAGNCDRWESVGDDLPHSARFTLSGVRFLLVHDRADAGPVSAENTDVVVFGHSHMPLVERHSGVLWVNPGSAQQARRSEIGRSVAFIDIGEDAEVVAEIVALSRYGEQEPAR